MMQRVLPGLVLLSLLGGCATSGVTDTGPRVSGSEAIVSGGHDVIAYISVGGVT